MKKKVRAVIVFLGKTVSYVSELSDTGRPLCVVKRQTEKVMSELEIYENALVDRERNIFKVFCTHGNKLDITYRYYISETDEYVYAFKGESGIVSFTKETFNHLRFVEKDGYCKVKNPYGDIICCNKVEGKRVLRQIISSGRQLVWLNSTITPSLFANINLGDLRNKPDILEYEYRHIRNLAPIRLKVLTYAKEGQGYYVTLVSTAYLNWLAKQHKCTVADLKATCNRGTVLRFIEKDYEDWSKNEKITEYADTMAEFLYC